MKRNARILFASFASLVVAGLVGSDCLAAGTPDPVKVAALKKNIVKFAQSKLGTKVDLGQGGECTELIHAALKQHGGQPIFHRKTMVFIDGKPTWKPTYGWGSHVLLSTGRSKLAPPASKPRPVQVPSAGSIVQFENCKFGSFDFPHHTAIVESVSGTRVTLLHQNMDGSLAKSVVRRHTVDFATKAKGGGFSVFYPLPR